jgi:hypothetical protein
MFNNTESLLAHIKLSLVYCPVIVQANQCCEMSIETTDKNHDDKAYNKTTHTLT